VCGIDSDGKCGNDINMFHFETHGALRRITITFKPQTVMHR